jgi:diguanylate cyclase (GGDEF)-like protein
MDLPMRARLYVATVVAAAAGSGAALTVHYGDAGFGRLSILVLLAAVTLAAWAWPLIVYRGSASEAVHADEGLLFLALVLLPPRGVLATIAVAAAVGPLRHRRGWLKALFNWAEVIVASGAAILVTQSLDIQISGRARAVDMAIALVGAATFFVLSAVITAGIIAATSTTTLRASMMDGAELRLLVFSVGCFVAAPVAMAARSGQWAIVLLPPLYLAVRWVVAGRFDARHDRDRMLGLFDATLAVHRPIASTDVRAELARVAGQLLRCPEVRLSPEAPTGAELGSAVTVGDTTEWLALAGRPRSEPFDAADRRLLDALAVVGKSALSRAEMYARVKRQGDELAAIMGSLAEGVIAFALDGQAIYVNPAGEALLGASAAVITGAEVPAAPGSALVSEALDSGALDSGALDSGDPDAGAGPSSLIEWRMIASIRDTLAAFALRCLSAGSSVGEEAAIFVRFDTVTFPASYTCAPIMDGSVAVGAVLVFRDVTERVTAEQQLAHHTFHDQLTGLPNRRLFLDRLNQALLRSESYRRTCAVLFVDIDRFKSINDNLGHQAGDELLQEVARRIGAVARPPDTVARFGGDEFTILVEDIRGIESAQKLAARIHSKLAVPVQLSGGREVVATVSIGIATSEGQPTADDILHNGDLAMSQAKAAGVGGVQCYDPTAMQARSAHRFDLEADLRAAIAGDQLEVHYQPLVDLHDGSVRDVEALIRWPNPKHGLRMPSEFIPIAEESGLILPLGRFVLAEAARQAHRWEQSGLEVNVAVNLSARQFQDEDLIQAIADALNSSELPPQRLCLEITESLAMQDLELTIRTLARLKMLGVHLAIDDFGTGYSSLNYLKRFPVDEVKIDQSFIRDLKHSQVDRAIVAAIVGLADALGMRTVVEGVEDEAQLSRVRDLGCGFAQGYHVSVPRPGDQLMPLLLGHLDIPRPRDASVIDLTEVLTPTPES